MTVVNIVNQDLKHQNVAKGKNNSPQQIRELSQKTPYFGQKRVKANQKKMEECLSAKLKEENHFAKPCKFSITFQE
jgi:hypothetical protein